MTILKIIIYGLVVSFGGLLTFLFFFSWDQEQALLVSPSGRHRVVVYGHYYPVFALEPRLRIVATSDGRRREVVRREDDWLYGTSRASWSADEKSAAVLVCGRISPPEVITFDGRDWARGGHNREVENLRQAARTLMNDRPPKSCLNLTDPLFWYCCQQ